METVRRFRGAAGRRGALRTRLLILFLTPVMLLGLAGLLLFPPAERGDPAGSGSASVPLFPIFFLAALLLAAGFALHVGDRIARPVAWLLRWIDAGDASPPSPAGRPAADWELELLGRKVEVLLKQNLSGARAVEELERLRGELAAILDAVAAGRAGGGNLCPDPLPTHPLTRRLLDFFRNRTESQRDARDGLTRLQGLLEQDWREETLSVEEIAKRSERCFLEQTELAMELQRLARSAREGGEGDGREDGREYSQENALTVLADLRLGIQRWREEAQAALEAQTATEEGAGAAAVALSAPAAPPAAPDRAMPAAFRPPSPAVAVPVMRTRFAEWTRWVDESLDLLEKSVDGGTESSRGRVRRLVPRLKQVAETASRAGQELGRLSREAAQLERTWQRLGERLRSLMARIGEVHASPEGPGTRREGGAGRDAVQ